jgi:hypothetical protein
MPDMSFHDLPADIRSIALTDAVVQADVIDLILGLEVRHGGGVAVMVCDDRDRGIQPVVVSDIPETADVGGLRALLDLLLPMVGEGGGSVLIGRGRRRGLVPTDRDRAWHQCAIEACRRHGVRLLGFHPATPRGVVAMPGVITEAS